MRVALTSDLLVALTGQPRSRIKDLLSSQPEQTLEQLAPLCRWLAGQGWLTEYQAQHAAAGRAESLLVGQYVILGELGHGSMGMVYKARHRLMERLSALKVFTPDEPDCENLQRFMREIQATAQLDHPNLVKAYEAGEHQGSYYLAMELVDGENLQQRVERTGRLDWQEGLAYLAQAAAGLDYAHELGMIHRDVKPGNVMVGPEGKVLVLDLGLVRFMKDVVSMTSSVDGSLRGTAAYMAPEQALSIRNADHRSDIYSLGSTLFFILAGRPMFEEKVMMQQLLAHQNKPAPAIRDFCPDLPPDLEQMYYRMVAKAPQDRYQAMHDVVMRFQAILQGQLIPESPLWVHPETMSAGIAPASQDPPSQSTWRRLFPFWRD
jgi:serine/threonine protein kinase